MHATPHCPHCNKVMTNGYILDVTQHGKAQVPQWVAGEPEKSFWTGLKMSGRAKVPVMTYRCPRCGLLQSYAVGEG